MVRPKFAIVDLHHQLREALPASDKIFYQCLRCWDILPSLPEDNLYCACKNVSIDIDAGRAGANDETLLRVLEITRPSQPK